MAYSKLQNAAKCLTRASAEVLQAAREIEDQGGKTDAGKLKAHAADLARMRDALLIDAGGNGGPPAKKPVKSPVPAAPSKADESAS